MPKEDLVQKNDRLVSSFGPGLSWKEEAVQVAPMGRGEENF